MTNPFLLEIGVEEMPAKYIDEAREELRAKLEQWLNDHRLSYGQAHAFSTPRRLSVIIEELAEEQENMVEEARGPALSIAKNNEGDWTKAAIGFARGQGVDVSDLVEKETEQGTYVFAQKEKKGQSTANLLSNAVALLTTLTFPKSMRWGSERLRYVRPIRWIAAMYGEAVIPYEVAGVQSGRQIEGHRFLGNTVVLDHVHDYEQGLLREHVLVDPEVRKEAIRDQLNMLEEEKDWSIEKDEDLLEEVNNLVEYPTVLNGTFDERFLTLPADVLITTMREHQRYFAVRDNEQNILPFFVTVRNGDHRHLENVQKGNEKVLRARLSDAVFFYQEDQRRSLEHFLEKLDHIVEHESIGSLGDKRKRTAGIARKLALRAGFHEQEVSDGTRAAHLLKFDQSSHMVDEFPELQGIMGADYALKLGEKETVASAIKEHYLPRFNGDDLPSSDVSALVSMADKWDTIVTSFAIGLKPTGSQDPYGLRRQAAAIVQMVDHYDFPVSFEEMLSVVIQEVEEAGFSVNVSEVFTDVSDFFSLRLKALLSERGIAYDVINAVLFKPYGRLDTLLERAVFLQDMYDSSEMKEVAEALGRVNNIAKKVDAPNVSAPEPEVFEKDEETKLYHHYEELKEDFSDLLEKKEITKAWEKLVALVPVIHHYFDCIMVMSDNSRLRENRLNQMAHLSMELNRFARFQELVL
ncbi:glycyl-tRNA synthetase beta chain [Geomicrobium halophilum]|uniref:Glycine--tRNA ligase beta subunit n=1 Tax=Geomicrobium halophilum TaxID=549000 RepID=A0A841PXJ4_9BACL|nr:glycine--tRNA ligase subunit beta [Geomicrobium halophilum]MBB6448842.1 glycyl-tRNA synthetase beta chain [Geomicrobium halophilum]